MPYSFSKSVEVADADIAVVYKTIPFMPKMIGDMVRLQLHAGTRAQDLCNLTLEKIDRSKEIWTYTPDEHKTAYRGKKRTIVFSQEAQKILMPYLEGIDPKEPIFPPAGQKKIANLSRD